MHTHAIYVSIVTCVPNGRFRHRPRRRQEALARARASLSYRRIAPVVHTYKETEILGIMSSAPSNLGSKVPCAPK